MDKKYCECGCGQKVKKGNRFIHGHNGKKEPKEQKECECGCGQLAKPGNRFIVGHNGRGIKLTKEQRKQLSETTKNNWKNPKIRALRMIGVKKAKNTEKGKRDNRRASRASKKVIKEKLKNDPIYREKRRKQTSITAKKLWATRREHMLKVRRKQWTKKARENMSIASKKRLEDPNERKKFKERAIERWSDPKLREKQSKIISEAYINGKLSLDHKQYKTGYIETSAGKIFYQSSYEKRFIYILEYFFKDQWKRCPIKFPYFDGEINRNYIPDFLINDKFFIEVKGWFNDKDKNKVIKATKSSNLSIYLIFEKQLIFLESLMNVSKTFPFKKLPKIQNGIEYLK